MRRALGVIVVLTASTLTTFPAAATPPTKPSASAPSSVAPRPRPGPPVPGVRQPKPVVTPDCATLKAQRYALARQGHRTALCLGRGRLPKGWTLAKALAVPVAKAPAAKAPRARRPDGLEPEPPGVAIPAWCNDGLAGGWDQWDPTWMSGWAWLDRYHVCFNEPVWADLYSVPDGALLGEADFIVVIVSTLKKEIRRWQTELFVNMWNATGQMQTGTNIDAFFQFDSCLVSA